MASFFSFMREDVAAVFASDPGYAWARLWGFHAITLHVTMDTRLIVHDFDIS